MASKTINNLVCFDFETGGLDCTKDAVTQVCFMAIDSKDFSKIDTYVDYVYPYNKKDRSSTGRSKKLVSKTSRDKPELYGYDESKMLEICGTTMQDLYEKGEDVEKVVENICNLFNNANSTGTAAGRPFLLGQNAHNFDVGFLQKLFWYCGKDLSKYVVCSKDFYGNSQPFVLDTLYLAKLFYANDDKISKYALGFLCDKLEIELVNAHDALADVEATKEVAKIFFSNMRSGGSSSNIEKSRKHFKF